MDISRLHWTGRLLYSWDWAEALPRQTAKCMMLSWHRRQYFLRKCTGQMTTTMRGRAAHTQAVLAVQDLRSRSAMRHLGDTKAQVHKDYTNIKVGDILRVDNDTHSVIVLEVRDNSVIVAEGNYNASIHWGREIPNAQLIDPYSYIMTRY